MTDPNASLSRMMNAPAVPDKRQQLLDAVRVAMGHGFRFASTAIPSQPLQSPEDIVSALERDARITYYPHGNP